MALSNDIKDMKLYTHFERVDRELLAQGKKSEDKLDPKELYKYDHMNYYGTSAVADGIQMCCIDESCQVLDLGSGLGGPARFISCTSGAKVTALELQEDCSEKAKEYTDRCGISNIRHVCTDFTSCDFKSMGLDEESFDAIVSWLVILHIDNKQEVFDRAASLCKKGGYLYIEDFFIKNPLTAEEIVSLKKDVYCATLLTKDDYIRAVAQAGFEIISFVDLTDSWIDFVTKRRANYIANKEATTARHGKPTYDSQLYFFSAIEKLFKGLNLGGCRLLAKKA